MPRPNRLINARDMDSGQMMQREVAEHMGLTFQAIQHIERKALVKVRKALARRGLTAKDLRGELEERGPGELGHGPRPMI